MGRQVKIVGTEEEIYTDELPEEEATEIAEDYAEAPEVSDEDDTETTLSTAGMDLIDVSLIDPDGNSIEPQAPVQVEISVPSQLVDVEEFAESGHHSPEIH